MSDLEEKGKALLKAANDYKEVFDEELGGGDGWIWLEGEYGEYIVVTTTFYKRRIESVLENPRTLHYFNHD